MQDKPGATYIVEILPEGTPVKKGDVVCRLDKASFEDELKSQQIRYIQAKAVVDQVNSMLEVNKMTLREYREGTLPLDIQTLKSYRETCKVATKQSKEALEWGRVMSKKKLRTPAQLSADESQFNQAVIIEAEAELMEKRLINFTSLKNIRLEAKIEANRADLLRSRPLSKSRRIGSRCSSATSPIARSAHQWTEWSSTPTRPTVGAWCRSKFRKALPSVKAR